jgi:pimeloyl-ACP methyl ester carboxylesterase
MIPNALRTGALAVAIALLGACATDRGGAAPTATPSVPVLDTGTLGEAPYRIEIPADWNGDLVMLLHGYEPQGVPRATPWPQNEATPAFLAQGYAVAESAYASQGWAVADAVADTERLRAYFTDKYTPRRAYLVGFSMGGQAALAGLERHGAHYDGALSLCGANVPARHVFEDALTSLVAFDYFFPDAKGLPGNGLSDPNSPPIARIPEDQIALMQTIGAALTAKPDAAARLAADGRAGVLALHYLVFREMQVRAGGLPVDNRKAVYTGFGDDAAFNAGVRRYAGDADAMAYLARVADLTGDVHKPLVLRYNRDDPTIPTRYHAIYPALMEEAGSTRHLTVLPAAGEGHCGFSPAQISEAFDALTRQAAAARR